MSKYFFTVSIVFATLLAYLFPQYFISFGDFEFKRLIIPLLQLIMFGMGTSVSKADFMGVVKMPQAVLIGLVCQFSIMPFFGFGLTKIFNFPPEIAAGIILVGCSPSGLASNVMAYIAKANVALSITITATATLLAPLLTPFLMKLLGGQYISVDFWAMAQDIFRMIIIPIVVGYFFNHFFGVRYLQKILPIISMISIALIIVVITANGQQALKSVGLLLLLATLLHNLGGFFLGYWFAKFLGLAEQDARTVSIEVGLQNAGLASALAVSMGKASTVGVSPALFGPIMNTTGSLLASWWGRKNQ